MLKALCLLSAIALNICDFNPSPFAQAGERAAAALNQALAMTVSRPEAEFARRYTDGEDFIVYFEA